MEKKKCVRLRLRACSCLVLIKPCVFVVLPSCTQVFGSFTCRSAAILFCVVWIRLVFATNKSNSLQRHSTAHNPNSLSKWINVPVFYWIFFCVFFDNIFKFISFFYREKLCSFVKFMDFRCMYGYCTYLLYYVVVCFYIILSFSILFPFFWFSLVDLLAYRDIKIVRNLFLHVCSVREERFYFPLKSFRHGEKWWKILS